MNTTNHITRDVILFFIAFFAIQLVVKAVAAIINPELLNNATAVCVTTALSSVLTIALFAIMRWTPLRRDYLRSRPWGVLFWASILTLGTIIPSEVLNEIIGADMPENMAWLFNQLMLKPWGFAVIAVLVPVAEEMVFRGAILRTLLSHDTLAKHHWLAIAFSALLFAVAHGNMAQIPHAFLMGLLLGWMYYRTRSLVPGLVVHFVNNSVAFIICRLMPGMEDARLIDLLQGNHVQEALYVGFSLLVFLPALYQLHSRFPRHEGVA